jgi:[pyruvate, water dikinase]-phosphate phosphotransferase / [pyruvate, water dikinase] kinase
MTVGVEHTTRRTSGCSLPPMSTEDTDREPVELHIVSDSTGETAARLVLALEAQFPDQPFVEIRHPRVENVEDLIIAVQQARGRPAVMVYTLVEPGLRDAMRQLCRRSRVHYCDLLGHPIDSISRVAGVAARMTPGVRAPLDAQYFKRIEAIEFAVKYDDGVGRGLDEADVVLVGVSRTSKTPLSIYLGYLGHKAANVPVVKGIDLPEELFEIDPAKIVGLTIDAERLADIRTARVRSMGAPRKRYAELEAIYGELEEAAALHRRLRCPVIDVSELSVEETAMRIIRLVERRRRARKA